jgi:amidase
VEVVRTVAQALADMGLAVVEDRPKGIEQTHEIYFGLLCAGGGTGVEKLLQSAGTTEAHPFVQQLQKVRWANMVSSAEFGSLIFRLDLFRSAMLAFMENYDVILCPVSSEPAPPHGATFADERFPAYAPMFSYTMTYNMTGWPGAVVRAGTSPEGLPIGVQIVARPWREDVALAVAQSIETVFGGWQRPGLN